MIIVITIVCNDLHAHLPVSLSWACLLLVDTNNMETFGQEVAQLHFDISHLDVVLRKGTEPMFVESSHMYHSKKVMKTPAMISIRLFIKPVLMRRVVKPIQIILQFTKITNYKVM